MMSNSIVDIPSSTSTVKVWIINTTHLSNLPASQCMSPIYEAMKSYDAPSYSFLIEHVQSGCKIVFDLGVAEGWRSLLSAEDVKELTETLGIGIEVQSDVAHTLAEHGVCLSSIDSIIYSHHHYDHVGDPSTFPTSTNIVVGPGFKAAYLPGYPTDLKSELLYDDAKNKGRIVIEVDFDSESTYSTLNLGQYRAIDFFRDGSFYLLDTPGHTIGHMSALARTTAEQGESTFILLGGDIGHHASVFRPSQDAQLPAEITPSPVAKVGNTAACPCAVFTNIHYRKNDANGDTLSRTTPFGKVAGPDEDLAESQRSLEKLMSFDAMDNILTIFAHDQSLYDVLEYFPSDANQWKRKGWKTQGHWRFLSDLVDAETKKSLGVA